MRTLLALLLTSLVFACAAVGAGKLDSRTTLADHGPKTLTHGDWRRVHDGGIRFTGCVEKVTVDHPCVEFDARWEDAPSKGDEAWKKANHR